MNDLEQSLEHLTKAMDHTVLADGLLYQNGRYFEPRYDDGIQQRIAELESAFAELFGHLAESLRSMDKYAVSKPDIVTEFLRTADNLNEWR